MAREPREPVRFARRAASAAVRCRIAARRSRARRHRGRFRSPSPGYRAACPASSAPRRSPRRPGARRRAPAPAPGRRRSGSISCARAAAEADFEALSRVAAPRMKHGAPAAFAMGVDQLVRPARRCRPAPAPRPQARASIRDSGRSAQCCIAQPPQTPKCGQIGAMRSGLALSTVSRCRRSGWPGARLDRHGLARQRIGHEERPGRRVGDAVAAMRKAGDGEALGHGRGLSQTGIAHRQFAAPRHAARFDL